MSPSSRRLRCDSGIINFGSTVSTIVVSFDNLDKPTCTARTVLVKTPNELDHVDLVLAFQTKSLQRELINQEGDSSTRGTLRRLDSTRV